LYKWGSSDKTDVISLNGKPFTVRRNLLGFLEIARKKRYSKPIWIDALCINQSHMEERVHQVQLMGKIYSGATEVWTWLGDDEVAGVFRRLGA
jgi:hypothetical protein